MNERWQWWIKHESLDEGGGMYCATAESALEKYNELVARGATGYTTNARCTAPDCTHPALVPDGLCRGHAVERAAEMYQQLVGEPRWGRYGEAIDWLRDLLSLGLSPADLNPGPCPECHHLPSGRVIGNMYGGSECYCPCHNQADAIVAAVKTWQERGRHFYSLGYTSHDNMISRLIQDVLKAHPLPKPEGQEQTK